MIELQSGNLNSVSLVEERGSHLLVLRKPQLRINVHRTMGQVMVEHSIAHIHAGSASLTN